MENIFVDKILPVLEFIIGLVGLWFTYKSFDFDNNNNESFMETRILQINPTFNINVKNEIIYNQTNQDNIIYQNKKYISNSIFTAYLLSILGYIIISYLFMTDFSSVSNLFNSLSKIDLMMSYKIFEKCLEYSTLFIMVYCIGMLLLFINKSISLLKNIIAMKYYSLKIISDILLLTVLQYMQINFFWGEIYIYIPLFL